MTDLIFQAKDVVKHQDTILPLDFTLLNTGLMGFNELIYLRFYGRVISHGNGKFLGRKGIARDGETVQDHLTEHDGCRLEYAQPVQTGANGHSHSGGCLHTCGGGQTLDRGILVLEDHACAKERDAADHLRRHAGGIG